MAYVVESKNGKMHSLGTKYLKPKQLKSALSPLAWKILLTLTEKPSYPKELSRSLKVHEQKIYYHIKNLLKSGLIKIEREETKQGALTKYYAISSPSFSLLLKELEPVQKITQKEETHLKYFKSFIKNGKMDALIIMGSPEPHGPKSVYAHDSASVANFSLFLGTFLNRISTPSVKWDTKVRTKDLKNNLILIGGPAVNFVTAKVNSKLPIRFKRMGDYYSGIYSNLSKKEYTGENQGFIVKIKNPFDKSKEIIVIAGRRDKGTDAAILAFLRKFKQISAGNKVKSKSFANVVEGIDADSDGIIDSVKILE